MCINNNCTDTSLIVLPAGQDGTPGTNGTNGTNGVDGQNGIFGGFSAKWKFDATTGVGAASTYLKFNSTILSGVTSIEVNKLNASSVDHADFLTTFVNTVGSTDYFGLVRVWKEFDSNIFWLGRITASTSTASTRTFTVTHIESNGTFTANDNVVLNFTPNGAIGDSPGTNVIFSDHTVYQTSAMVETNFITYNIVPNLLPDLGDQLDIQVVYTKEGPSKSIDQAFLRLNGSLITFSNLAIPMAPGISQLLVNYTITRRVSDQAYLHMKAFYIDRTGNLVSAVGNTKPVALATANTHTLDFNGSSGAISNTITLREVVIKKFEA